MDRADTPSDDAAGWPAPSLALFGLEPVRAVLEFVGSRFADCSRLPVGDGHPVVVFPGLAADPAATSPLVRCCERLGYATHDWGRGFNTGPQGDVDRWLDELACHVQSVACAHDRSVSLIGWSLGGIYAREIARILPSAVRQVITLGTPFGGDGNATNVGWIYRLLSGQSTTLDPALARRLRTTPPVPTTSIYSRSDGVVAWQSCLERDTDTSESVEVEASHCGLICHPQVWQVVADRLALPEGSWRPYAERAVPAAGLCAAVSARVGAIAASC